MEGGGGNNKSLYQNKQAVVIQICIKRRAITQAQKRGCHKKITASKPTDWKEECNNHDQLFPLLLHMCVCVCVCVCECVCAWVSGWGITINGCTNYNRHWTECKKNKILKHYPKTVQTTTPKTI